MVGGGPFSLAPGKWTDDTSMALCLAESLLNKNGFDATDQMGRYLNWWQWGYNSSTGDCFDIGMTVRQSLSAFQSTGNAFAGSTDRNTAGNGSLMRLAPIALFYYPNVAEVVEFSAQSSLTTHGAREAVECCSVLGFALTLALSGAPKKSMQNLTSVGVHEPKVSALTNGEYLGKSREEIVGSGYCVASLEAALWCFHHTDSFEAAVLEAANLGDDADTTAAIVGQIAGAHYGLSGIPHHWLERLHLCSDIDQLAMALFNRSAQIQ
jgi:ADP-ribosyl-[dinitrogen reductase] hydrolase